jgi:hypothetical protein
MRAMLFLNVVMYHCGGLLAPASACCESVNTSNHSKASAASARPSKKSKIACSVSTKGLFHVWLMNHVAGPTCCAVVACAASSCVTLQRRRDVRGRRNIFSNCDVVSRPKEAPNSACIHRRYSSETPYTNECEQKQDTAAAAIRFTSMEKPSPATAAAGASCNALMQLSHTA